MGHQQKTNTEKRQVTRNVCDDIKTDITILSVAVLQYRAEGEDAHT